MDEKLSRIKELIGLKERTDAELYSLIGGSPLAKTARKPQTCSVCGQEGHTARTCAAKPPADLPQASLLPE